MTLLIGFPSDLLKCIFMKRRQTAIYRRVTCLSSGLDPETGPMPLECGLCSGPLACLGPEPVSAWAALSISAGERLPVPPATTAKPMHGVQPGQRGPPVIS